MSLPIFDEQGHKLELIDGNDWHKGNGSEQIMDYRFTPFE